MNKLLLKIEYDSLDIFDFKQNLQKEYDEEKQNGKKYSNDEMWDNIYETNYKKATFKQELIVNILRELEKHLPNNTYIYIRSEEYLNKDEGWIKTRPAIEERLSYFTEETCSWLKNNWIRNYIYDSIGQHSYFPFFSDSISDNHYIIFLHDSFPSKKSFGEIPTGEIHYSLKDKPLDFPGNKILKITY